MLVKLGVTHIGINKIIGSDALFENYIQVDLLHLLHLPPIINPRRACAARVTVLGVCVRVSTLISLLRATKRMVSDTNGFSVTRARNIKWRFS